MTDQPLVPIPRATLLAVTERMLADLRFPGWVDATRLTQLTLTRAAVTADWVDDQGGQHRVTIAVGPLL